MDRIKHLIFFAIALYIVWAIEQKASNVPEQIHVSLGRNENEYVITWTTFSPNEVSHVWYGTDRDNLVQVVNGKETLFVDGGAAGRKSYVYRAFLSNLKPKTRYYYKCGSKQSISPVMEMITLPSGNRWETRMLVMGDMGVDNARSFPFIQDEVDNHNVDLIFHNGDFAYDMYLYDGKLGDQYMNMMQSVISKLPYQTSPGNHELAYNFSHYVNRFSMYDQIQNGNPKGDHFYAFHVGPALIISFSTEFYYWPSLFNETNKQIQEKWMKSILIEANRGTNRAKHPWILVFGHRPMYCTNDRKDPDCYENALIMRSRLEDMFFEYGVDLAIWAHEHTYERTYPVYRDQIRVNYTSLEPYTNPGAPVHIVTGSAGCNEGLDAFDVSKPWSKFHQSQYGYAKITFHNETTLKFEQIDTGGDWAGQVIDSFTLVQNRHGPFSN